MMKDLVSEADVIGVNIGGWGEGGKGIDGSGYLLLIHHLSSSETLMRNYSKGDP